jgi:hypothetical protein
MQIMKLIVFLQRGQITRMLCICDVELCQSVAATCADRGRYDIDNVLGARWGGGCRTQSSTRGDPKACSTACKRPSPPFVIRRGLGTGELVFSVITCHVMSLVRITSPFRLYTLHSVE